MVFFSSSIPGQSWQFGKKKKTIPSLVIEKRKRDKSPRFLLFHLLLRISSALALARSLPENVDAGERHRKRVQWAIRLVGISFKREEEEVYFWFGMEKIYAALASPGFRRRYYINTSKKRRTHIRLLCVCYLARTHCRYSPCERVSSSTGSKLVSAGRIYRLERGNSGRHNRSKPDGIISREHLVPKY